MTQENYDSLYHNCRWCKWFKDGMCINEAFGGTDLNVDNVYQVAEDGRFSEVIGETLHSLDLKKLDYDLASKLREYKLSGKRIEEIKTFVRIWLESFFDYTCKDALDEAVSKLYQEDAETTAENASKGGGVEINNPEGFYCKEFW